MPPTGPSLSLELQPEQRKAFAGLSVQMKLVAMLLFALAGLNIVLGAVEVLQGSAAGLLDILIGVLLKVSGLVMLTASTSAGFATEVPEYDKIHTFHVLGDLAVFYKFQFGLGALLALILAVKILV